MKHNPNVQPPKHQMRHRADKEAHERAMLAASTLTCTSLSKSVTTAWCLAEPRTRPLTRTLKCVSACQNGPIQPHP